MRRITTHDILCSGKWYPRARVFYMNPRWWYKSRRCVMHIQLWRLFIEVSLCRIKLRYANKVKQHNVVPKFMLHELLFWRFGGDYHG